MGENHFASMPVAIYGSVMLMAAFAYFVLSKTLISHLGKDSALAIALGKDYKGKTSLVLYLIAVLLSFVNSWISVALYVLVAMMWFIPDRRIENALAE
jgi:uncharacterized membrane protein